MSATRKISQTLAGHLLVFVQGLVLTPVIIKSAGPETFGAYVLLLSYLGVLFGVSSMGVGISAKRWLPGSKTAHERAQYFYPQFWFQLTVLIVSGSTVAAVMMWVIPEGIGPMAGFSPWIPLSYLSAYALYSQATDYFRYTHRVGIFNISTVAQPYLFVLMAIGFYLLTDRLNVTILMLMLMLSSLTIGSVLMIRVANEVGVRFALPHKKDLWREVKLGFPLVLAYLVDVILAGGDRYLIAAILSVRDVGMYAPAYALGSLAMVLPKVFGVVLPPLLSQRVDAGDEAGARRLSTAAARFFLLVAIPFTVGSAIVGKDLLRLYTDSEIAEAAWPVIASIAFASIFYGLMLIKANILFVRLRTGALFQINIVCALLNVTLNTILLKIFGDIVVAAFATIASYSLSYMLLSRQLRGDSISFSIDHAWVLRILVSGGLMAMTLILMMSLFADRGFMQLSVMTLTGGLVYAGVLLLQRPVRDEIGMILRAMRAR